MSILKKFMIAAGLALIAVGVFAPQARADEGVPVVAVPWQVINAYTTENPQGVIYCQATSSPGIPTTECHASAVGPRMVGCFVAIDLATRQYLSPADAAAQFGVQARTPDNQISVPEGLYGCGTGPKPESWWIVRLPQ